MGFIRIAGYNLLEWGRGGNDRFTRTPSGWQIDPDFEWNKTSQTWEVVSGKEMELFTTTSALQKVIGRHASMFANGRFIHKRMNGTKEGEVIEDSPLVEILENPNPLQSGEEWLTDVAINYWVYGNCVMLPVFPAGFNDVPYVINNLPFDQLKIKTTGKRWKAKTADEIIQEYRMCYNTGEDDVYKASEVLHFRRSGGKSAIVGESMLTSCHMEISNIRGAMGYRNANINKKGALGIWANKTKDDIGPRALTEDSRIKLERQQQEETHGHFDGQSSIRIVDGDVNFIPTSFAIKENMLFEEISEDTKVLIDLVQLNDNIFSKEKSKIQANLLEGLRMGYQDGIFPFAGRFCSLLKRGLKLPNNEWLELDYSHLPCFQEDEEKKSEIDKRQAETVKLYTDIGISLKEAMELAGVKQP